MNTVLIVDDHTDIRRLLSITLSKDFTTIEAEDGESALDSAFVIRGAEPSILSNRVHI